MAVDSTKIGHAAAVLMERIEEDLPEGELLDVLVIAEIDCGEYTAYRWKGSSNRRSVDTGMVTHVLNGLVGH